MREVDPVALSAVTQFSKLTGDYQRLSIVDLKVMALTYQMEKQFNGTSHLNSAPRPAIVPENKTHGAPARRSNLESEPAARDTSGDNCGDHETIDPSEFERAPMFEGGWVGGADDRTYAQNKKNRVKRPP